MPGIYCLQGDFKITTNPYHLLPEPEGFYDVVMTIYNFIVHVLRHSLFMMWDTEKHIIYITPT